MTRDELLTAYASDIRDFSGANLRGANLSEANLRGANLSWTNLIRANLSEANLSWANLIRANLSEANLSWANLYGADLREADLYGANLPPFQIVPDAGAFTAWKKLADNLLCEVEIPADAPRTSSLIGRKCRAAWVIVRGIQDADGNAVEVGYGTHDCTTYRVGATVVADDWDDDIRVECSHGIHFFITMQEARDYQP